MPFARKIKETAKTSSLVELLNELLANMIDFKLAAKQAHWNVRGKSFIALHELFDKLAHEADEYADVVAERIVQLHGTARGTAQMVSNQSCLAAYPVDMHGTQEHVRAISGAIGVLADAHRNGINTAMEAGDVVTADILTGVTRGLDKYHWFVRSHLND